MCVCVHACVRAHVCVPVVYVYIYVCVCVCMCACVRACTCVCACACVCLKSPTELTDSNKHYLDREYSFTHTHIYTHTPQPHTHAHAEFLWESILTILISAEFLWESILIIMTLTIRIIRILQTYNLAEPPYCWPIVTLRHAHTHTLSIRLTRMFCVLAWQECLHTLCQSKSTTDDIVSDFIWTHIESGHT